MFGSVVVEVTDSELVLKSFVDASTVPQAVAVIETVAPVLGLHESLAVLQMGWDGLALAKGETMGRTSTNANASANIVIDAERIFSSTRSPVFGI